MSSNSPIGVSRNPFEVFDEESPYNPYMGYGRSKQAMEEWLRAGANDKSLPQITIIRAPWFYGPEQPARQTRFFSMIKAGRSDHPLGIGANHFAVIGNIENYYARAGVKAAMMARAGNVHNFYYLTAAETGYQGLIALLLLLISPLFVAFRCGWRNLGDYRGDLLLGLGVALLTVYLHS
jgi:nucleoside-diphosphate-sugar epimerase